VVGGRDDARHKPGLTQTSLMVINFYCATYSISILPLFFEDLSFSLDAAFGFSCLQDIYSK
jgi:hypothetical protein